MNLEFHNKLIKGGFNVEASSTEFKISLGFLERYPNAPSDYLNFLKSFTNISTTSDTSWFNSIDDFDKKSDNEFTWNAFELMSLEWSEDDLEELLNLPAGINPLKRQILLARLIDSADTFTQGFHHALFLAQALGQFMDQVYTENLELGALKDIVPEEFANHWQITLKFLEILSESWPKILKEQNLIDVADRRNQLILGLSKYWQNTPPQKPVIAAGTTGSIPAVAGLLSVIANLPQGKIVLPGFDESIDKESWSALEETHPQYGFKQLLERIGLEHEHVQPWPQCPSQTESHARRILCFAY